MWGTWTHPEGSGGWSRGVDERWFGFVMPPTPVRRRSRAGMGGHGPALGFSPAVLK